MSLVDIRNKKVWTFFQVPVPVFAVFLSTFPVISNGSMVQDDKEEDWEEPWEWRGKATHESPSQGLGEIGSVVDFSAVFVPTISEQDRTVGTGDVFRILQHLFRQVRESLSDLGVTSDDLTERVFLSIGGVEEVVSDRQDGKQGHVVRSGPVVLTWVVVVEIQSTMAVSVWDTGNVPEDQHESKLLVRHVPSWNDQLFTFSTGVGVEVVCIEQEPCLSRYLTIGFVLFQAQTKGEEIKSEPRQSDLEEHFQVDDTDSWVQWSTHKDIVEVVSGHSVVITRDEKGVQVQRKTEDEPQENGHSHDLTEQLQDSVELEHS